MQHATLTFHFYTLGNPWRNFYEAIFRSKAPKNSIKDSCLGKVPSDKFKSVKLQSGCYIRSFWWPYWLKVRNMKLNKKFASDYEHICNYWLYVVVTIFFIYFRAKKKVVSWRNSQCFMQNEHELQHIQICNKRVTIDSYICQKSKDLFYPKSSNVILIIHAF